MKNSRHKFLIIAQEYKWAKELIKSLRIKFPKESFSFSQDLEFGWIFNIYGTSMKNEILDYIDEFQAFRCIVDEQYFLDSIGR